MDATMVSNAMSAAFRQLKADLARAGVTHQRRIAVTQACLKAVKSCKWHVTNYEDSTSWRKVLVCVFQVDPVRHPGYIRIIRQWLDEGESALEVAALMTLDEVVRHARKEAQERLDRQGR
jgi:hypothetical protein